MTKRLPQKKIVSTVVQEVVFAPASKAQEQFLNSEAKITFYGGAAGAGKALRHGEKVLLTSGFVNIEDVQVGDEVITPSGKKEIVKGVYPQNKVDIYRVVFQDGNSVDVCGDHLWSYHEARGRGKNKVSSTIHLKERMDKGFRPIIPLTEPVEFSPKTLAVKPYTLGVLLGDGCLVSTGNTFVSEDPEIIERVISDGYEVRKYSNNGTSKACNYGVLKLNKQLISLGLKFTNSKTKFIPNEYKTSCISDRFSLIQGLMDTDGYVDKNGNCEYTTVSESLALDVKEVLNSLGFTCTITTKIGKYKLNGKDKLCSKVYTLYIRGKYQNKLFSLTRKKERTKYKKVGNRIISIEKIGIDYATCISISGEDKLFLTTNYIVTHNSHCLLGAFLKYCHHPRTRGVILRKTTKQISNPGGLFDNAINLYKKIDPKLKVKSQTLEIHFSSGAQLKFSYLDKPADKYNFQGAELTFVGFDEVQQLDEDNVMYLISRLRSTTIDYPMQIYATGNPDYDSFIRHWVEFALDKYGIPIRKEVYPTRYFVRVGARYEWSDSLEELELKYGPADDAGIHSFKYIPGNIYDNPILIRENPSYLAQLKALPRVEMERLLLGSWYARESASGYFKREWIRGTFGPNFTATRRVRAWDLAFSEPSEVRPDVDATVGLLMSKDKNSLYTIENVVTMRKRVHEVEQLIFKVAEKDGFGVVISLPLDPGATAGAYCRDLARRLSELGYIVKLTRPEKGKMHRFLPFASACEAGYVNVVEDDWNKEFFTELETMDFTNKTHDDFADACSDAFYHLCKEIMLPEMNLGAVTDNVSFQNKAKFPSSNGIPTGSLGLPTNFY